MKNNKHIKLLLSVIFFGALWGIVEATLGSILHIGVLADTLGLFGTSTVIVVPIACALMMKCYKKEGCLRSILYMGLIAAGIKALTCGIFHMSFNPVYHILLESACFAGAVALIKPTETFSLRTLGAFALANTVYVTMSATLLKYGFAGIGSEAWTTFVITRCGISLVYASILGLVGLAISKIEMNKKFDFNKLIYSPVTASVMLAVAVMSTVVLR